MNRLKKVATIILLGLGVGVGLTVGVSTDAKAESGPGPAVTEVYDLLRANLPAAKPEEMDRAAIQGILQKYNGQVMLVTNSVAAYSAETGSVGRTNLLDDAFAYVRIDRVGKDLPELVRTAFDKLSADRRLNGLLLDLRFAHGADYGAAAGVADLFIASDKPQLEVDGKMYRSTAKGSALTLPVTVLVNRATSGAAEALAALFRQNHIGLILGTNTAGEAYLFKDHPLSDGAHLRIATGTVKLADGQPLLTIGVRPDILVEVSPAEERQYLENAYGDVHKVAATPPTGSGTNALAAAASGAPRKKLNEAELVRRQREGQSLDDDGGPIDSPAPTADRPLLRDPVMLRALDLLKGLAVVKQFHR